MNRNAFFYTYCFFRDILCLVIANEWITILRLGNLEGFFFLRIISLSVLTPLYTFLGLFRQVIHPDCDIKFTGNVTWVGKTSMEVKMHMLQVSSSK